MRLSRPCYDKYHRCPGWAGGGMRRRRGPSRCDNGHLYLAYDRPHWRLKFHRCDTCDVVVLPYESRWLDWTWWKYKVPSWYQDLKWKWENR